MTDPEVASVPETASPAGTPAVPGSRPPAGWGTLSRRARAAVIGGGAGAAGGMGPGPLSVGFVSSSGVVPPEDSTMIVIPVGAAASTTAVIDAVGIRGGGGYHAPREVS